MTDQIRDEAMEFRALAHALRRAVRKGTVREGIPPALASAFADVFSEVADEQQVGNVEGAQRLIREVHEAFDRTGDDDDDDD